MIDNHQRGKRAVDAIRESRCPNPAPGPTDGVTTPGRTPRLGPIRGGPAVGANGTHQTGFRRGLSGQWEGGLSASRPQDNAGARVDRLSSLKCADRLAAQKPGVKFVPVLDRFFPQFPTQKDLLVPAPGAKVYQPLDKVFYFGARVQDKVNETIQAIEFRNETTQLRAAAIARRALQPGPKVRLARQDCRTNLSNLVQHWADGL